MITFRHGGDFSRTIRFLTKVPAIDYKGILERYGARAVLELAQGTPVDSGETKNSWGYTVERTRKGYSLVFTNSHIAGSTPVIILLQYGHGTRSGSFLQGRDIINPIMRPIFDAITEDISKEVSNL